MKNYNPFTKHPNEYGEGYFEHLRFAISYFFILLKIAIILLIHGIFPFLFTFTSSQLINKTYLVFQKRKYNLKSTHPLFAYIGATPLHESKQFITDKQVNLFVKCEFFNPSLSIKDRIVLHMLKHYEKQGLIKKGTRIYEASSGNTGTSLAMLGSLLGYPVVITVPKKISSEKVNTMKFYGAEVIISPEDVSVDSPEHYTNKAKILAQQDPNGMYFNQYNSYENCKAHYESTAREILEQSEKPIDYIILGASSGGTVTGVGQFFKKNSPNTKIILADPEGSIFYPHFHHQPKVYKKYQTEGVGKDLICEILDFSVIDDVISFSDEEAMNAVKEYSKTEGFLLGGSSGGALSVAKKLIARLDKDKPIVIVVIAPDSGYKYLSKMN